MTNEEMIEVIQAYADGKKIEYKALNFDYNWEVINEPPWNFSKYSYRVKAEPLEQWVNTYDTYSIAYSTKQIATETCDPDVIRTAVHMREVV